MTSIPHAIFKAYDIRGLYPSEVNEDHARKIGGALARHLGAAVLVVGRDMRTSSDSLFAALSEGMTAEGVDVVDIGVVSTPILYFAIWHLKAGGGVMVTASHNPARYNGFKVCRHEAIPVNDAELKEIGTIAGRWTSPGARAGTISRADVFSAYADHVLSFARHAGGMTIAVDAGNGMGGAVFPRICREMGAGPRLIPLYCDLDGTFPHHEADPLKPKNMADLQAAVRASGADLGAAFDGDADRVMLVDEKGDIITADLVTALLAEEFLRREPGATVVYDLRSSRIVREVIEKGGGTAVRCRVGHAFIKKTMRQLNAAFAGELSGHFYFRKGYTADNSDIPVLMVMDLMARAGKSLSALIAPYRKYWASGEINSTVTDTKKKIREVGEVYADGTLSRDDGILVEYADWWFNIRESNTEPLLRLNLEADSREKMEQKRDEVLALIRST